MEKIQVYQVTILVSFLLVLQIYPQNLEVYKLIGKKQNEVTKTYGNPVHKDNQNPNMVCMFYKTNTGTMIFVSDKEGVYQAEATKTYKTENEARTEIDSLIKNSVKDGFTADSVSVNEYIIHKKGNKVELQLSESKINNNFEIRIKAKRVQD